MPKMRALIRQPAAVIVLLALFAVTAHATTITLFTSRDEFQSQFPNSQVFATFDNTPDTPAGPNLGFLTVQGLTLIGDMRISGGAANFTAAAPNTAFLATSINFNGNTASHFGADIFASRAGFLNFSLGGSNAGFAVGTSPAFVGFSSDLPFQAINFTFFPSADTGSGFNFVLDNIVANTVSGVPEPSTLLLLGAGAVIGLVRLYTRRPRSADAPAVREGEESDPS